MRPPQFNRKMRDYLIKSADVIVFLDDQGRAVAVNRHGERVAGPSKDHAEVIQYVADNYDDIYIASGVYNLIADRDVSEITRNTNITEYIDKVSVIIGSTRRRKRIILSPMAIIRAPRVNRYGGIVLDGTRGVRLIGGWFAEGYAPLIITGDFIDVVGTRIHPVDENLNTDVTRTIYGIIIATYLQNMVKVADSDIIQNKYNALITFKRKHGDTVILTGNVIANNISCEKGVYPTHGIIVEGPDEDYDTTLATHVIIENNHMFSDASKLADYGYSDDDIAKGNVALLINGKSRGLVET